MVHVFFIEGDGRKQITTDPPVLSLLSAVSPRGECNPWVSMTVDRQRDNNCANTIIDSHLR